MIDRRSAAFPACGYVRRTQNKSAHEHAALGAVAAKHGRQLHDVRRDNRCQFHALLHAAEQVVPSRVAQFDADSLRAALVDILDDEQLLERVWVSTADSKSVPVEQLWETLAVFASRSGRNLRQWMLAMRQRFEWGDNNTLVAAALLAFY